MAVWWLAANDPLEHHPHMHHDQHFGHGLRHEDFFHHHHGPALYRRPWRSAASRSDAGSVVTRDKDKFQADLDVQQFKPEEITVKVLDNVITVEGKHEEKADEHGYISRHFVRKYVLPKGHDIEKVDSKLSSDGVLTITAPKIGSGQEEHREIPIVQTGQPKAVQQKKDEEKKSD